ncbi:hypothetical protein A0J48_016235 [Sphaerospermopsis aphanizomenoides BCCUSP55]|uniref:hypothetical protein n=1 Tax=Sphaerospermopsis aphanizomenoides TaxID=459663 RepID=UPI001902EF2E|nr:hypothetical protein [Sphaerospermopsis aphanizomenoides]MBK1989070.1 hypothetical protein [Sphaerospermopsis aphanizomenoides BCCUSP55]
MEHIQQRQRCAASQEFQQSLNQLEDILQVNFSDHQSITELTNSNTTNEKISENTEAIDIAALEDAVADIEQYLAQKEKNRKTEN